MPNYSTMDASDGNYMVINGVRYPVINSWVESGPTGDDRMKWGIVTEGGAPVQDEDQEDEGEPIMKPLTGFDHFLMDKYSGTTTRDSGGIPPTGGVPVLPPYTPPAP